MSGLRYVYAVCRPFGSTLPAQLTGVAGVPPKPLTHHGLVAVVSAVPEEEFAEEPLRAHLEDPHWLSATTRAHKSVIDALTVVTSPLPLRLATVFRDDSGVRTMMEAQEGNLLRTLDRLDGRVEWGVEVYAESAEDSEAVSDAVSDAVSYSVRAWVRAEDFARRLHGTLARFAEDARIHTQQNAATSRASGRKVLNAAYLVPRSRSEEFVELVDRAKGEKRPGLRVELTGPWAAYSFSGLCAS